MTWPWLIWWISSSVIPIFLNSNFFITEGLLDDCVSDAQQETEAAEGAAIGLITWINCRTVNVEDVGVPGGPLMGPWWKPWWGPWDAVSWTKWIYLQQ
ncbi:hypothetical protein Hamer_G031387, partial [Homarus americanus]